MVLRIIMLILAFLFLICAIIKNPGKAIIGYTTVLSTILLMLSIFAIENGLYISELETNSYPTGGTWRLSLFLIVYIFVFFFSFNGKKYKIKNNRIKIFNKQLNKFVYKYFPYLSLIVIIYIYLDLALCGSPLFDTSIASRMNYFKLNHLPFVKNLYAFLTYYFPILWGVLLTKTTKLKKSGMIYAFSAILYEYLLGFKVSGILPIIIGFAMPSIYIKCVKRKLNISRKKIVIFFVIIFIMFSGILVNYTVFGKGKNPVDQLNSRIFALASHTWWVVDNYAINNQLNSNQIYDNFTTNLSAVINEKSPYNSNIGVAKIMYKFAPLHTTEFYLANNTRMGATFITTSVYDYGYVITIFIVIIFALFASKITLLFSNGLINKNVIEIILSYKLLIYLNLFLWSTGTITDFFNRENFIIIAILILYYYIAGRKESKK